ncbi:MAG TPA: invasin domain 3-containing protein, partial [Gemmatimonadales bacterium]|nr:invasin domain 3-containing protein [Gemmatimonadales bacterium]
TGVATFPGLSIDKAGAGYTLSASSGTLTAAASQTFTITVGSATQLAFTTQPSTTQAGAAMTPAVRVAVQDAGGNLVATATNSITVAIGANPGGATLSGTTTVAATAGVAQFGTLSLSKSGTGYTLVATASGLANDTSTAFTVTSGGVSSTTSTVVAVPASITASSGSSSSTITVTAKDGFGNPVVGVNVVLAATGAGNTLTQPAGTTDVNGVATGHLSSTAAGAKIVSATIGATAVTQTDTVTVTPASAASLAFTIQPSTTVATRAIAPAVQVTASDAFGNRATAFTGTVTMAIGTNAGGGTLTGTLTAVADSGIATFANLRIDKAAAGYTLRATSGTLTAGTSGTFTISVGPAANLAFAVQPANTAAGTAITPAVLVAVQDSGGNVVTTATNNISVALGANPGGGTLSGTSSVSASGGVAQFTNLSIDKTGTGYTLTATGGGLTSATSLPFTITSGAADHLAFFVQPSNATAGSPITPAVQVEIVDAQGNVVTADTRNISVAILDNPNGGSLSGTTTVAATSGVATFSSVSIDKAGTGYTLQASSSPALTSAISADFDIAPAAASRAHFFVEPSTATAGVSIVPAVQVEIVDAFGNRVATATNSVSVALLANPAGGALSGTKSRTASAGVATFTNLSINKVATGYTLRATSSGLASDTSVAFNITPGPASQLVFSTQPTNTAAGATIPAVAVTAQDAQGNTATGFTGNVTMAIGTNPGSGTLSGTLGVPAVSGVATFADLSIDKVGTGYTLTAAATGPANATSGTFNITVGGAARLAFGQEPASTTGGATISPAVTVRILDASGNLTASTANVTLAITPGTGTAGAHLSSGSSVTVAASSGVATFNSLSVDSAGAAYTLNATSSGVAGDTSSAFTIAVGSATEVGFLVQPSNTPPGAAITPAVQVEVRDAGGNRVTTDNTTNVTVAIGTNPSTGTLAGTLTQPAVSGVASFANLSINNAGSGYTLTAGATSLGGATSNTFNIVVGTATKLAFGVQPSNVTGGTTISPAVTVEIRDAGDNVVTTATNSVTLAFGVNPGNGHLSGTKTVAAVSGVATFNTLSIDSAGTGYTLTASASGLTGTTSNPLNVTVGPAAKLGFLVQPANTTGGANITPGVQVEIRDAGGNRVTTATNAVAMAIGTDPNSGTLSGSTPVAAVNGLATFSNLSIDSAGTGYRLSATASGLSSATSNTFNITVGAAAKLGFLVQPSDAVAGSPITPAVKVEIR